MIDVNVYAIINRLTNPNSSIPLHKHMREIIVLRIGCPPQRGWDNLIRKTTCFKGL
jgi:hypothetical protein